MTFFSNRVVMYNSKSKAVGEITCRLPLGQYSVTMQMLGGSMQAPMNLVRWLN